CGWFRSPKRKRRDTRWDEKPAVSGGHRARGTCGSATAKNHPQDESPCPSPALSPSSATTATIEQQCRKSRGVVADERSRLVQHVAAARARDGSAPPVRQPSAAQSRVGVPRR